MIIYVSGPISDADPDVVESNKRQMAKATMVLRSAGYEVVCPLEVKPCDDGSCGGVGDHTWQCWLRYDIVEMLVRRCTHIMLLPGWAESRGAKLEFRVARGIGMSMLFWNTSEDLWRS